MEVQANNSITPLGTINDCDPRTNNRVRVGHFPGAHKMKQIHHQQQQSKNIRIGTLNIGTLTGRSAELANIMKKRRIDILGLQETKWKGQKSRQLPHGFKLLYNGSNSKRNGVAIIVSSYFEDKIINVNRLNDRLIMIKIALPHQGIWNIISAYGPQTGCTVEEKVEFWHCLEGLMETIPLSERRIILCDLNGHVGEKNASGAPIHGGFGFGDINAQGKDILEFATSHHLAIVNTFFEKQPRHLITYSSSHHNSQIDYILSDFELRKQFSDCKVILGESICNSTSFASGRN